MPTQNAASEVVLELQVSPGSVQLALTLLKELPVSAYPDQLVDVTSLRPLNPGDLMPTLRSVGWYPTVSLLISDTAIAFAAAAAEWVAEGARLVLAAGGGGAPRGGAMPLPPPAPEWVAVGALLVLAPATSAVPASRPIAGSTAAKE